MRFNLNPELENLLLDDFFIETITQALPGWCKAVGTAVALGVPVPAFSSALSFYDGYRSERLPANLLQAQRDYFGAHTYERLDRSLRDASLESAVADSDLSLRINAFFG